MALGKGGREQVPEMGGTEITKGFGRAYGEVKGAGQTLRGERGGLWESHRALESEPATIVMWDEEQGKAF